MVACWRMLCWSITVRKKARRATGIAKHAAHEQARVKDR